MDYLTKLLGTVAAYGVRAEDAARDVVERTADEFALAVVQTTGLSFEMLASLKTVVVARVSNSEVLPPGFCKGRTKHGVPCRKRVFKSGLYCEQHKEQHATMDAKRRRVRALASRPSMAVDPYGTNRQQTTVAPARFRF